jgi:hypothetical protein
VLYNYLKYSTIFIISYSNRVYVAKSDHNSGTAFNAIQWDIDTYMVDIIAGSHIVIDKTDPTRPVINANLSTTAGILTRVYFTGEEHVVNGQPYYKTLPGDKGSIAKVTQVINVDDNQKKWFAQDVLGLHDALPWWWG